MLFELLGGVSKYSDSIDKFLANGKLIQEQTRGLKVGAILSAKYRDTLVNQIGDIVAEYTAATERMSRVLPYAAILEVTEIRQELSKLPAIAGTCASKDTKIILDANYDAMTRTQVEVYRFCLAALIAKYTKLWDKSSDHRQPR